MEFHCNPYKEKNCKELNEVDIRFGAFRLLYIYKQFIHFYFIMMNEILEHFSLMRY